MGEWVWWVRRAVEGASEWMVVEWGNGAME
jgi:hypothetical protein